MTTADQPVSIFAVTSLRLLPHKEGQVLLGRRILLNISEGSPYKLDDIEEEIGVVPPDWDASDMKDSQVLGDVETRFDVILTEIGHFVVRHTSAPDSYDWRCTTTIERYQHGGREWRKVLIRLDDSSNGGFGSAQCDRYFSGACAVNTRDPRDVERQANERIDAMNKRAAEERQAAMDDEIVLDAMNDQALRDEIERREAQGCSIPNGYARPKRILKAREREADKKAAVARFEEMRAALPVGLTLLVPEFHRDRIHRPECVIVVETVHYFHPESGGELRDPEQSLVSCWSPDWPKLSAALGVSHRGGDVGNIPIGLIASRLDMKWIDPPQRAVMLAVSRSGGKFSSLRKFTIDDEVVWVGCETYSYEPVVIRQSSGRRVRGGVEKEAWTLWREAERAVVGQSMGGSAGVPVVTTAGIASSQPVAEPAKQSAPSPAPPATPPAPTTQAKPTDQSRQPGSKSVREERRK